LGAYVKTRYLALLSSVAIFGLLRLGGSPTPAVPEINERARQLAATSIVVDGHGALDKTRTSIIASNSSVRVLVDSERNLTDKMLRVILENGVVFMINFGRIVVDPRKNSIRLWHWTSLNTGGFWILPLPKLLTTLLMQSIAGIDHVGLGPILARNCPSI